MQNKLSKTWIIFDWWKNVAWVNWSGSGSESAGSRIKIFVSVAALDCEQLPYCFLACDFVNTGACDATYLSSCYIFVTELLTWESARSRCHSKGGHLATIDSQEEKNVIYRMVNSKFWNAKSDELRIWNYRWKYMWCMWSEQGSAENCHLHYKCVITVESYFDYHVKKKKQTC